MANRKYDLVVIGAGLSGIIAAQRYLDVHPSADVVLLDKEKDVGGVFTQRRLYDTFWTQWTHGLSEFSDFPMPRPPEEDTKHDFYKSKYFFEYLQQYVDRKDELGRTLRDRIIFKADVRKAEKKDGIWNVSFLNSGSTSQIQSQRLIVASGLCSFPNMPDLPGMEEFGGPIIHSSDYGESSITETDDIKRITVIGGGKSSADMIYEAVKSGKEIDWVIRSTGTGPPFFAPGKGRGPFKNAFEAASTRLVASLNPSIYNPTNAWTRFLRTRVGTQLINKVISTSDSQTRAEANYKGRKSDKGFEKLEYDTPFFWQNGPGGILHHDDFWEVVANDVTVHRDEVDSLAPGVVRLATGIELPSDAILCGTGFKSSIRFFDTATMLRLGLPVPLEDEPAELEEKWAALIDAADKELCIQYPVLSNLPKHHLQKIETTTYRLYHGIAPLDDDSILFINQTVTGNKVLGAEVQAMWSVAYFDKQVALPPIENAERDIARLIAFSRRRYLSNGQLGNGLNFETIIYTDALLKEMDLSAHGKGSKWKDMFEPFWPKDLGRAWNEYLEKQRCRVDA